ncbi:hypothetical protein CHOCRA_000020 [Candidatus Hodgkinia cicadicola]|nr:hypothetical protein CHOCRA_000020 [Candidatus Hodgkinia cicadicola]
MNAKKMISLFNIDGICYTVKLLRLDKLLACLQHGVLILGTESVSSKRILSGLCGLRNSIVCLSNKFVLWLARSVHFDYVYYIKTRLTSLNLSYAKRMLVVLGSSLLICFACARFRFLISSVFYSRLRRAFNFACLCFIRKLMWKVNVCRLWVLESKCVNVLITLFGVCLFVLNIKNNDLIDKRSALKFSSSVKYIINVCTVLGLNIRKLLFIIWSLRIFKPNTVQTFIASWLYSKFWILERLQIMCNLGEWKLSSLRMVYFKTIKRLTNMLSCWYNFKKIIFDKLGSWRILIARLLSSLRALMSIATVELVFEWCNLALMCCWSVLYCITFYKILVLGSRVSFVAAFLNLLANVRAHIARIFRKT